MFLISVISLFLFTAPLQGQQAPTQPICKETHLLFRWDKSSYDESYLANNDAADVLFKLMEKYGEQRIDSVSVVSFASPEGSYKHNIELSETRALQFNEAVKSRIGLSGSNIPIRISSGGEAWEMLREAVAADSKMSEDAKNRTLKLLDNKSISNDIKKWRMAKGWLGSTPEEGDVYKYLLKNHYRYLRCLVIKIYLNEDVEEDAARAETVEPAVEQASDQTVEPASDQASDQTIAEEVTTDEANTEGVKTEEPQAEPAKKKILPIIGVSTNLIYDATWIPNYGFTSIPSFSLEYYPAAGHYTFGADVDWSHWLHPSEHRYNQIHNITLNARRYFRSGEEGFRGLYLLGNVNAVQYGLGWNEKGWEGEGLGASLGIGHKWVWGRFFIDTGLALGVFYSGYDPYVWGNDSMNWYYYDYTGDPEDFVERRLRLTWFGPTRAYISIGVNLFNRKR